MNSMFSRVLAGVFFSVLSLVHIAEAQTMNTLNARQQAIVPIASFTANGDLARLKTALNEGLEAGLSVNEIKEVLVQMYAYTGFPRSLNALGSFSEALQERERKGVKDEPGKEASAFPSNKTSLELGTEIQTSLVGMPVKGGLMDFAPAIDVFLKVHLFGDIFARDNLDFQSREIATIAALASLVGVEGQLQSHFNIGMNTGLNAEQMRGLVAVLERKIGTEESERAGKVLDKVLSSRKN
jgi:alkylhydroperoxidase/carboxymuconolactone decarboxylase family protein YurZ